MTRPRENRARERKIAALLAEMRVAPFLVIEDADWPGIAKRAGVKPPSEATIAMLKERVRKGHTGRPIGYCACGLAVFPPRTWQCEDCEDAAFKKDAEDFGPGGVMGELARQRDELEVSDKRKPRR